MDQRKTKKRAEGVAEGLLAALERAVGELDAVTVTRKEKAKTDDGEIQTEYEQLLPGEAGLIDRGGLKQLTGVLKDMREILGLQTELERQEQLARLKKLERELSQEETALAVSWEDGIDGYAQ